MTSEPQQKRAIGVITWVATRHDTCLCAACNYNNDRCGCADYRRELVTRVRTGCGNDLPRPEDVYIREFHSGGCAALDHYLPDYATFDNPLPRLRTFGPKNRFEPMAAADALHLKTDEWDGSSWLYRAFNGNGELLYVGITQTVAKRMRNHRKDSDWWPHCQYVELEVHPDRKAARDAERRAIRTELPAFNIAN